MSPDLSPSTPEAVRSLPGLRPVGLDAEVRHLDGGLVLAVAGRDLFVLKAEFSDDGGWVTTTWRDSGPHLRRRRRPVPEFATVASLGLERGLRLRRAFLIDRWRWWPPSPPLLLVGGRVLPPADVVALLPSADEARDTAVARVADVRARYGRMLSDIAYRIENSALFDPAVPATNQFETALALWADVTDATPGPEVVRLAATVRVTFDTARANAETLGLAHLPEQARDDARRAAGAARLAAGARSEGEREAAHAQVVRILGSLALYYLPDPSRLRAITRG